MKNPPSLLLFSLLALAPTMVRAQCYSGQYQAAPSQQAYGATSCYSSPPQSFAAPQSYAVPRSYAAPSACPGGICPATSYSVAPSAPVVYSTPAAAPARQVAYDAVFFAPPAEPAYLAPIAPARPRIFSPRRVRTVTVWRR